MGVLPAPPKVRFPTQITGILNFFSFFKILLVDDEPDILEIISYTLKSDGYLVYTAENVVKSI